MKKILLLFVFYFIFSTFYSKSQVVFNRIDTLYTGPAIRNVVVQDTIYVSVGGSTYNSIGGVVTRKNNLEGNIIETKYFADTNDWYHGVENSLKEIPSGNYILGGNRAKNYFRDNLLIKFDNNFDTIFTKKYYPVDDNGNKDVITYSSCIDIDSNYLLVGLTNIDNSYNILPEYQMQLIKTDTLGDLLWRKVYGNSSFRHYGYKVVPAFGGGYLLGGWADTNGGDWALVKTDENGENPIFRYFGHSTYDDGRIVEITKTSDSCYIVCGKYAINGTADRARIFKLDKDLNIIWEKLYLNYASISFFIEAIEKSNGNIVVYGANQNSLGMAVSELMELTSEGDYIWQQTIAYDTVNSPYNYAYNAKITPDGGLIMTGKAFAPSQQMWLVKTDSMGCDGTEYTCGTTYLEALVEKGDNNLILYPNPVRENLHISLNLDKLSEPRLKGLQDFQDKKITNKAVLNKIEFDNLLIDQKLKYSSKNPNNTLWGKKEEQEMRELSRKLAYAFPFEVIKGKVDIFSIDPALNASVIARNEARMTKQSTLNKEITSSYRPRNDVQEITIYDIFGRIVKKETLDTRQQTLEINVSSLQKGIYFVKVGENVAKFVKE